MATKHFIRQTLKIFTVTALLSVMALGSLMVVPLSLVSAAPLGPGGGTSTPLIDSFSLEKQAQVYSSIKLALDPESACQIGPVQNGQLLTGDWMRGKGGAKGRIGHHVEPTDGVVTCENENKWFSELLDDAGFSTDYMTPAQLIFEVDNLNNAKAPAVAKPNANALLRGLFERTFYNGGSIPATAPTHIEYEILHKNFTATDKAACQAKPAPPTSDQNARAKLQQEGWKLKTISVFDVASNTAVAREYAYQNSPSLISVGYGLGTDGTGGDGRLRCDSIANALANTKYAAAAAKYIAEHPNSVGAGAGGESSETAPLDCDAGWNPLNWLLCAAVKGMVNIVGSLDSIINSMLSVGSEGDTSDPSQIFGSSTTNGVYNTSNVDQGTVSKNYYEAWSNMRNIALGLMVLAGLVVIIAQALGSELVDAYTVRKILPRLLIAAIGITLSWQIMQFFVKFTNELGLGVRSIIYGPFADLPNKIESTQAGIAVDFLALGSLAALGIFGLLSFAATAALAVFVAMMVLILRQVLIIVLIIFAPIAIVAYILPNTQKIYKVWYESFSKALLMFPIIAAFIAAGRVFSLVSIQNPGAINQIIGFIAYFAPYFMLPLAFKFAGGALSTLGGFVNDRGRGGFDRLKNFRGGQQKKRMENAAERARTGKTFKHAPAGSGREKFNTGVKGATLLGEGGFNPTKWKSRMGEAMSRTNEQQRDKMLEDNDFVSKADDDWNRAASEAGSESQFRQIMSTRNAARYAGPGGAQNLELDTARYRKMESKYGRTALKQASFLQAVAGGTAFNANDPAEVWQAAAAAAGGDNGVLASLVGKGRGLAMNAGRADQGGAGFGDTMGIAQKFMTDRSYTLAQANQDLTGKVLDSQSAGTLAHASMKPNSVTNLVPEMRRRLAAAVATGDQDVIDRQLAFTANFHDALAASSPNKAAIIADQVLRWDPVAGISPITPGLPGPGPISRIPGTPASIGAPGTPGTPGTPAGPAITVQQRIENARTSEVFQSTRREYSTATTPPGSIPHDTGGPGGPNTAAPTKLGG